MTYRLVAVLIREDDVEDAIVADDRFLAMQDISYHPTEADAADELVNLAEVWAEARILDAVPGPDRPTRP